MEKNEKKERKEESDEWKRSDKLLIKLFLQGWWIDEVKEVLPRAVVLAGAGAFRGLKAVIGIGVSRRC